MSTTINIRGVSVQFPFEPYELQKDYMEKVIECIQNETTAVLESPTGTGKTLSLLCSSLAWLQVKKSQVMAERQAFKSQPSTGYNLRKTPADAPPGSSKLLDIDEKADIMAGGREFLGVPKIVYASRTHSQLHQAVQEMKRSAYSHMSAIVLGSRDQLCIHREVLDEKEYIVRKQMCQLKVALHSCHYQNNTEKKKSDPKLRIEPIKDIEDMIKLGQKHVFCPYYMAKELQTDVDIVFIPYSYLFDPPISSNSASELKLNNAIVILDEGHNVESFCEDRASIEIKSTDIALAIDETTNVMKMLSDSPSLLFDDVMKTEVDPEHVANLKMILIEFEKVLDGIPCTKYGSVDFPGDYIFELLEKVQITPANYYAIVELITKVIQYLTAQNDGPFARKGKGLQIFSEFLYIAFHSRAPKEKIRHCYRVHIDEQEIGKAGKGQMRTWLDKGSTAAKCRILSFWCFNPGLGMQLLTSRGIKALILTSGTLAPLKPLISELALDVTVSLENPHIVKDNQFCIKVLTRGPDGEPLNSNYRNRDNAKYVSSLGRAIVNLTRIIPNGLLIFFPSYPVMLKCQSTWEAEGIWANIASQKAIFVEPKGKEAFNAAMSGYYEKVKDPNLKGAIFMGVCRGKVAEGLDFADANGRAVIITGLPYPPLKDPRVILKRKYLDACHAMDKRYLNGQSWYSLEATRAVNQAIGRVIRHRHDYGAILLLDERFSGFAVQTQISKWLRDKVRVVNKYGEIIRDLSQFFRKAQTDLPAPQMKPLIPPQGTLEVPNTQSEEKFSVGTSSASSGFGTLKTSNDEEMVNKYLGTTDNPNGTVDTSLWKRETKEPFSHTSKRKRIHLTYQREPDDSNTSDGPNLKASMQEYVLMVKGKLGVKFAQFANHLKSYRDSKDIDAFIKAVDPLVPQHLKYIFIGMDAYITEPQRTVFRSFLRANNLTIPEDL